jgi:hypothetical protein
MITSGFFNRMDVSYGGSPSKELIPENPNAELRY